MEAPRTQPDDPGDDVRGRAAAPGHYYQTLMELWQDADPELQPRVESARRAVSRLAGEGGGVRPR